MSRKQEIYKEMLRWGIPLIRDRQARGAWERFKDRCSGLEAQLLHTLPNSILEEGFVENDLWFLNYHARAYLKECGPSISPNYELNKKLIAELFALVPPEQRTSLQWPGPKV